MELLDSNVLGVYFSKPKALGFSHSQYYDVIIKGWVGGRFFHFIPTNQENAYLHYVQLPPKGLCVALHPSWLKKNERTNSSSSSSSNSSSGSSFRGTKKAVIGGPQPCIT